MGTRTTTDKHAADMASWRGLQQNSGGMLTDGCTESHQEYQQRDYYHQTYNPIWQSRLRLRASHRDMRCRLIVQQGLF